MEVTNYIKVDGNCSIINCCKIKRDASVFIMLYKDECVIVHENGKFQNCKKFKTSEEAYDKWLRWIGKMVKKDDSSEYYKGTHVTSIDSNCLYLSVFNDVFLQLKADVDSLEPQVSPQEPILSSESPQESSEDIPEVSQNSIPEPILDKVEEVKGEGEAEPEVTPEVIPDVSEVIPDVISEDSSAITEDNEILAENEVVEEEILRDKGKMKKRENRKQKVIDFDLDMI